MGLEGFFLSGGLFMKMAELHSKARAQRYFLKSGKKDFSTREFSERKFSLKIFCEGRGCEDFRLVQRDNFEVQLEVAVHFSTRLLDGGIHRRLVIFLLSLVLSDSLSNKNLPLDL